MSAAVVGSHDEIDFRYCWTGNGSGFDALSSSSSLSAAVVASHNFWALLLLVFPVLTVFGNVLVVLGVYLVGK